MSAYMERRRKSARMYMWLWVQQLGLVSILLIIGLVERNAVLAAIGGVAVGVTIPLIINYLLISVERIEELER